jgi:tRNA(fMet)-specific endonuclease VapC
VSHLLDTSVCVAFLRGRDRGVRETLLAKSPADVTVCSVVKAELLYGARRSDRVEKILRRLAQFFVPFRRLPFDDAAAERYALVRAQLEREGATIGGNDLMIAAIALANDTILVTRNQREFRRVAGLRLEDW